MERVEKPEWNSYPAPMDLPRSAEDERFVQSFGVDNAAAATAFYDKYGFVIFDDILDADECAATTAEIWSYLEEQHPGLQRDDEGTWEVLSAVRYGLPEAQAIFTPQVVANRQNQRLYAALDAILPRMPDGPGEFDSPHPDPNSIVMSQDRWCVFRPTIKNPDWKTAENLHLDVNPWTYAGLNPSEIETLSYSATESGGERFPLRDFRIEMTAVQGAPRSTGEHVQGVLNLWTTGSKMVAHAWFLASTAASQTGSMPWAPRRTTCSRTGPTTTSCCDGLMGELASSSAVRIRSTTCPGVSPCALEACCFGTSSSCTAAAPTTPRPSGWASLCEASERAR
ncbi:unnamed protein product [Polarella glacialis]|uniref:Uncharacterized protein n=1 Tax=Polarella glacialis TaxID=89957 RepID=A0A813DYH0_POLGL|nr:unnamed protein product [Polarella glacialis]